MEGLFSERRRMGAVQLRKCFFQPCFGSVEDFAFFFRPKGDQQIGMGREHPQRSEEREGQKYRYGHHEGASLLGPDQRMRTAAF
jgi:hypothetical protein